MTEFNANLVASPAQRQLPAPWAGVRDALGAIRPAYFRLVLDWASIQPTAEARADLSAPHAGCMRATAPCLGWAGVRDQLKALASRQREGGWQALAVLTTTPDWAAAPPSGCERPGTRARNRPPRADALPAYRQLILDVLQAAHEEGADLRFWSAWNEPNHPAFVSPQRSTCDLAAPSPAPPLYAELTRTLIQALDEAPGDQQIVLGETAGYVKSTRYATSVQDFINGLPQDVVCASTVWSQHAYIGGKDPVEAAAGALAARGCPQRAHGLDHRDGRRRDAVRPVRGGGDHRRPAGLPRAARPARPVVQRPARDRGLPVHGARGRQVPDRPVQHRPQHRATDPERVDRLGRRARTDRAATARSVLNAA